MSPNARIPSFRATVPSLKQAGLKQECVWDYPRPPRLESTSIPLKVYLGEELIAATEKGLRLLETSHPPTYYFPRDDIRMDCLAPVGGGSFCEFKGHAQYFDVRVGGLVAVRSAWTYPSPVERYEGLAHCIAFYPSKMAACWVGSEKVEAQDGDFYGGWITSNLVGPFKGAAGTWGW